MAIGERLINYQVYTLQIRRTVNYGELQPDVWKRIQPGFIKAGILDKEVAVEDFLETSFAPALREITTEEVQAGIDKWKAANPDKVIN